MCGVSVPMSKIRCVGKALVRVSASSSNNFSKAGRFVYHFSVHSLPLLLSFMSCDILERIA